jgi:SM-20-related protein
MIELDLAALRATPLHKDPFPYLIVPGFVTREAWQAINAAYPRIESPGSFPPRELVFGPAFQELLDTLEGEKVRQAFEDKFQLDLRRHATMITVRGRCGTRDGNIHTDARSKILTVLLYMNSRWEDQGGRLRLLRSASNLEDYFEEVPPVEGTLLAFKRTGNSWHGHKPFIGERRVIQLNWVTGQWRERFEIFRHTGSAWIKRLLAAVSQPSAREAA